MPTAMFSFLPRSAWPMKPAIGACTESAMSLLARELAEAARRSRSPSRSGPRSRSRRPSSPRSSERLDRRLGALARRAPGPGRSAGCRAICERSLALVRPTALSTLGACPNARHASTCSSSTSTCGSPTSGARPPASSEWSLEVVAAFMRAAYGKGYCDALTEELPGSLCADHGYRVPERRSRRRRRLTSLRRRRPRRPRPRLD